MGKEGVSKEPVEIREYLSMLEKKVSFLDEKLADVNAYLLHAHRYRTNNVVKFFASQVTTKEKEVKDARRKLEHARRVAAHTSLERVRLLKLATEQQSAS